MEASLTFWIVSAIAIVGGVSAFGFWVIFSQRPELLPDDELHLGMEDMRRARG